MKNTPPSHTVATALAKYKRINRIDPNISVNGLVEMLQADAKAFDDREQSYKESLRVLLLLLKDDNLAFLERVREYEKSNQSSES